MPKQAKQWTSPANDTDVNTELFFAQDARDPRSLGDGPCQAEHEQPLTPRASKHTFPIEYGANQWQRWASCARCGLRVGSWPKHGYTGKNNTLRNPTVVAQACLVLKARGTTPSKKIMDALIAQIEAEEKLRADTKESTRDGGDHPPTEMFATPRTPKASPEPSGNTKTTTDCTDFLAPKILIFESQRPTLERSPSQTSVHSDYSRVSSETSSPQTVSERPASSRQDSTCPAPTQ